MIPDLYQWAPSEWDDRSRFDCMFVSCFTAPGVPNDAPTEVLYSSEDLLALLLKSKVRYWRPSLRSYDLLPGHSGGVEQRSPRAPHLFIAAPANHGGTHTVDPGIPERVGYVRDLLSAILGWGIAYENIGDYLLLADPRTVIAYGPPIYPWPDKYGREVHLQGNEVSVLALARTESLPPPDRRRVALALRWYSYSGEEPDEVDAFLKIWIAIETLSMPDTTNVAPVIRTLAKAYALEVSEVRDMFRIGRIQGLRSQILHEGAVRILVPAFITYLAGVFQDLLFEHLELPSRRVAEQCLNADGFELSDYLD